MTFDSFFFQKNLSKITSCPERDILRDIAERGRKINVLTAAIIIWSKKAKYIIIIGYFGGNIDNQWPKKKKKRGKKKSI